MYLPRTYKLVSFALLAVGLCASAAQADSDADADYAAAKIAYDNRQWQAAADGLQVYVKRHSDHSHVTKAHFFLAEAQDIADIANDKSSLLGVEYNRRHVVGFRSAAHSPQIFH